MADKKPASSVELKLIRDLAELLHESGLTEIELEQGGLRVRVAAGAATVVSAAHMAPAPIAAHSPVHALPAPPGPGGAGAGHPGAVLSPMVGTAYLAPEPGAAVFVKVGDAVNEGQTLLMVEAMKTFNPIAAPRAGRVVELLVTDGQPVEFGQVLAILE